ncbi:ABC transporter ATP-binding protein [Ruminococcus sp. OA3]|uniref:ABC transporter ATP-binding protein n=1 Tax=Ruminococcus sp. OA3 TaxID=2914164 RepID=UPI001F0686AA|nr:ABC transporter ATP-binding protein [Ruminococcus sp. OA3]MCH1983144.1 ABC transporter ATP-binding protein [Ruminococcus sp. OA3]
MICWKDITFAYQGQEAGGLKGVNLKVSRGECILFCGRSGCGKTTMLRLANGLIPGFFPGKGEGGVRLENQELSGIPMYQLAERIGSVFQNPRTQFFNVDTDSEIAFGIENEALPPEELKKRVEDTAEELQIRKLRGRSIYALSGGEKQKIAFASVYAMNPEVYVLDEPSSNLDMAAIDELRGHLRMLKAQGKTILIAEHRLYYVMELADRIVYLEQGKIGGIYTPAELSAMPEERRAVMGLRAMDLQNIYPKKEAVKMKTPSLEIRNVTLRYQKRKIVERIWLQAARGEIIAVVGQNGAGKSTFSRALCGLHKDCEGQFLWEGRTIDRKARRKHSYLVMQDVGYELFAESVEKECVFGIRNPDRALVEETLKELGLTPYRTQHPNTLSGGQKQRLATAVSMVCGKEILVFDEPTSGLDYDSMLQVAVLMECLAARGNLVFVVTHDYELICRVCNRILHFDEGEMTDDLAVTAANIERIRELFNVGRTCQKEGEIL